MCGIAGCLKFKNSEFKISKKYLVNMGESIKHRGPDDSGIWISEKRDIGLSHQRLSIVDLSKEASQPMKNNTGEVVICFNGEIYNHIELRNQLSKTNKYIWKSDHSDTEVVLNAYLEWGPNCVEHFRGMFAIAIWDASKEKLYLIRDRLGIKPLYYSVLDDRIIFASEIKSILTDKSVQRTLNEEAFVNQLTFMFVPSPQTMFKGINKLSNASRISFSRNGDKSEEIYWDAADFIKNDSNFNYSEIKSKLLEEILESVKYRSFSDVPNSSFLSGGIDSSLITKLLSKFIDKFKTFTLGYKQSKINNEIPLASAFSKEIAGDSLNLILSENDLIEVLMEVLYLQDEPISDPNCISIFCLSKFARKNGAIVSQVGEGADELFVGYSSWIKILSIEKFLKLNLPNNLRILLKKITKKISIIGSSKIELLTRYLDDHPVFWGTSNSINSDLKFKIFSSRLRTKFYNYSSWEAIEPIRNRFNSKCQNDDLLKWMTYLELNTRIPDLLLMRVDKMSMGASLECRVPFLDHKLIEYVMSIPSKEIIKNNNPKSLLKETIKGIIPEDILNRKKQGLNTPISDWINGQLQEIIYKEVKYFCDKTDLLNWENVKKFILDKKDKSYAWQLLNIALWWRMYIEKGKTIKNLCFLNSN